MRLLGRKARYEMLFKTVMWYSYDLHRETFFVPRKNGLEHMFYGLNKNYI
jgi:hypothetical protein